MKSHTSIRKWWVDICRLFQLLRKLSQPVRIDNVWIDFDLRIRRYRDLQSTIVPISRVGYEQDRVRRLPRTGGCRHRIPESESGFGGIVEDTYVDHSVENARFIGDCFFSYQSSFHAF